MDRAQDVGIVCDGSRVYVGLRFCCACRHDGGLEAARSGDLSLELQSHVQDNESRVFLANLSGIIRLCPCDEHQQVFSLKVPIPAHHVGRHIGGTVANNRRRSGQDQRRHLGCNGHRRPTLHHPPFFPSMVQNPCSGRIIQICRQTIPQRSFMETNHTNPEFRS